MWCSNGSLIVYLCSIRQIRSKDVCTFDYGLCDLDNPDIAIIKTFAREVKHRIHHTNPIFYYRPRPAADQSGED